MSPESEVPKPDSLDEARRLLAGLESDHQKAKAELERMHTQGLDHFRAAMSKAHESLSDDDLDAWTAHAAAMDRVSR